MRFYLDTEFIERGAGYPISLISIGIVAEDGRELYLVSSEFDPETASQWVKDNVLPHLDGEKTYVATIAEKIRTFVGADKPEFWGYYADYDWVVLCQLFGSMVRLPKGWPMYCRDIKQWCDSLGNPDLPVQGKGEHNAIADARWNKTAYEFLRARAEGVA